jgi:O-antigen ligase
MTVRFEPRPLTPVGDDSTPPGRARAARLLGGIVFYALLSLIALAAVPYGTVDEWWESLFQCVVFALAASWAVEGLLVGKWLVREHLLLVPLVPLLGFVVLQAVPLGHDKVAGVEVWRTLSADAYETRLIAFRLLALILVAAMLLSYTSSRRRLVALICMVSAVGVFSALFGLVRQTLHQEGEGFILPRLPPQYGYAQFINANHFALLAEMCLGLLLGLAACGGVRRRSVQLFLCLSASALLWTALVRSTSRGGIFAMAGQVIFLALLWGVVASPRRRQDDENVAGARRRRVVPLVARLAIAACLLFVVGLGVVWVGGDKLLGRMANLRSEVGAQGAVNRNFPPRIEMWRATWQIVKEHPLVGAGFGGYWLAINRYYDASGIAVPQEAHNDYLELLASGGLIAVVAAALFVGGFIKRARECLRSDDTFRRAACFGALTGLCGAALHSFVDFGLHITVNALIFTTLIVIATAHVRPRARPRSAGRAQVRSALTECKAGLLQTRRRHAAIVCVFVLGCSAGIWATAHAGLSRWHSLSCAPEYSLRSAERAVNLSPHDPTTRFFRAQLLFAYGRNEEALKEFRRAAVLRPRGHFVWINLGFAREREGDLPGALEAFEEAVRLAPFYAEPRWVLGGALLRAGERVRAFSEFSRAIASDPELPPPGLEMLWEASGRNAGEVSRVVSPQSTAAHVALARFFLSRGETAEAAALLRRAGVAADAERRALTAELIAAKKFREAYEMWSSGRGAAADTAPGGAEFITDGGFESDLNPQESGFGWRAAVGVESLSVSSDTHGPRTGTRSLRLDFHGDLLALTPIISQLVLVDAHARYRLSWAMRAQEMKTAGPLMLTVTDAASGRAISRPLPGGTAGWENDAVEFTTGRATAAVVIAIIRRQCAASPCLLPGTLWLDEFSLLKLTESKPGSDAMKGHNVFDSPRM